MKLARSILMLPRPPRAHRGEVSHLMIGLSRWATAPRRGLDGAVSGMGRMAVEHMGWQVLASLPRPKSHTLAFRFGSARKPRFYE